MTQYEIPMSEAELLSNVIDAAGKLKWRVSHFRPARTLRNGVETWVTPMQGDKGFPDLVLARERVVWVECKSKYGKLTLEEDEWLTTLTNAGQETHVWKPKDWLDGTILKILQLRLHKYGEVYK